jgi:hypothetical protein
MAAGTREAGANMTGRAYRCFLLRCRQVDAGGGPDETGWRFTVEQVGTHADRRSFARLRDVEIHLEAELAACGQSDHVQRDDALPALSHPDNQDRRNP